MSTSHGERCLRSPLMPAAVGSPSLRLFLSPSSGRLMYIRRRNSPSARASPNAIISLTGAHTSVDVRGRPRRSRKRKLTSDIWNDFTPVYDEDERLIQGQCLHCDTIFSATKYTGSSQCRRHRLVCTEKAKMDELIGNMHTTDPKIPTLKRFKFDKDKAYHELVRLIVLHELPFRIVEYEGFRRFLNLIVQDGLKVSCGAVDAIRESVKYVSSSPTRKEKFEEIVAQVGITCRKNVSLDVCTRWNSTYLMLKTASEYILAFDQLFVQDSSFICAPTPSQWTISEEICKLLVVFYDATLVVSGSLYPTSNTYFNAFWKVKWMLAKEATNENGTIRLMVVEMRKKFVKYWKLSYLTMCIPVMLDPRCKYKFLEFSLKDETTIDGPKCLAHVKKTFKEMFNAYSSQESGNSSIQDEHQTQATSMHDPWATWSQHVGQQQKQRTNKSELDMY